MQAVPPRADFVSGTHRVVEPHDDYTGVVYHVGARRARGEPWAAIPRNTFLRDRDVEARVPSAVTTFVAARPRADQDHEP